MTLSRGTTHSPVLQNGPSASATPGELPNGLLHPDIHLRMVTLTRFLNAQLHTDIHPALATPRSKRRTPETKIMRALLLPRPYRAVLSQASLEEVRHRPSHEVESCECVVRALAVLGTELA